MGTLVVTLYDSFFVGRLFVFRYFVEGYTILYIEQVFL